MFVKQTSHVNHMLTNSFLNNWMKPSSRPFWVLHTLTSYDSPPPSSFQTVQDTWRSVFLCPASVPLLILCPYLNCNFLKIFLTVMHETNLKGFCSSRVRQKLVSILSLRCQTVSSEFHFWISIQAYIRQKKTNRVKRWFEHKHLNLQISTVRNKETSQRSSISTGNYRKILSICLRLWRISATKRIKGWGTERQYYGFIPNSFSKKMKLWANPVSITYTGRRSGRGTGCPGMQHAERFSCKASVTLTHGCPRRPGQGWFIPGTKDSSKKRQIRKSYSTHLK